MPDVMPGCQECGLGSIAWLIPAVSATPPIAAPIALLENLVVDAAKHGTARYVTYNADHQTIAYEHHGHRWVWRLDRYLPCHDAWLMTWPD